MKRLLKSIFFFILIGYQCLNAQTIDIQFSEFGQNPVNIYYFQGGKVDSLQVMLDEEGKAKVDFPLKNYKGFVQMNAPHIGSTEFIVGEPSLQIVCKAPEFNKNTISYPGSKENEFLYNAFFRKSSLMEKIGWLQAGQRFYSQNTKMLQALDEERKKEEVAMKALDDSIDHTPLYAGKFLKLTKYVNKLYEVGQWGNPATFDNVVAYTNDSLDINALYYSGNLWNTMHDMYIRLFYSLPGENKQDLYAASINRVTNRLKGQDLTAFVTSASNQCERYDWSLAQQKIIQYFVEKHPNEQIKEGNLQQAIYAYQMLKGGKVPPVVGLSDVRSSLIIFYESGCSNCERELEELKKYVDQIQKKGIKVVSVSADHDQNVYEYHSKSFPWKDKLCDFKGFEGVNFKNYGVIATPTYILVSKDGKIVGKYARLVDTELLK